MIWGFSILLPKRFSLNLNPVSTLPGFCAMVYICHCIYMYDVVQFYIAKIETGGDRFFFAMENDPFPWDYSYKCVSKCYKKSVKKIGQLVPITFRFFYSNDKHTVNSHFAFNSWTWTDSKISSKLFEKMIWHKIHICCLITAFIYCMNV